jgi:Zinc finger, C3HC4 type (RING finger)
MGHGASRPTQRDASVVQHTNSAGASRATPTSNNTTPRQGPPTGQGSAQIRPSARLPAQLSGQHSAHNINSPSGQQNSHNARLPPIQDTKKRVSELASELMTCKAKLQLAQDKLHRTPGVPNTECIVCLDATVDTVILPCGHLCLCSDCGKSLVQVAKQRAQALRCPLCRIQASTTQRIFLHVEKPTEPPMPIDVLRQQQQQLSMGVKTHQAQAGTRVSGSHRVTYSAQTRGMAPSTLVRRREDAISNPPIVSYSPPENEPIFSKSMPVGGYAGIRRPSSVPPSAWS